LPFAGRAGAAWAATDVVPTSVRHVKAIKASGILDLQRPFGHVAPKNIFCSFQKSE
jgi:hypothetical protein